MAFGFVAAVNESYDYSTSNFSKGSVYLLSSALFVPVGVGLGSNIDQWMNEPIYERQPPTPRVTIAPWLERDRKGFMVQVHF